MTTTPQITTPTAPIRVLAWATLVAGSVLFNAGVFLTWSLTLKVVAPLALTEALVWKLLALQCLLLSPMAVLATMAWFRERGARG